MSNVRIEYVARIGRRTTGNFTKIFFNHGVVDSSLCLVAWRKDINVQVMAIA